MEMVHGSYVVDRDFTAIDAELERLRQQVELTWLKEREVLMRLPISEEAEVLDLGCGPGFFLKRLGQLYPKAHLFGMDPSPAYIDYAQSLMQERCKNPDQLMLGGVGSSTITERQFDLIVCRYVLQHLPDPEQAVRSVFSMLRPGGYAVFIDIDGDLLGLSHPRNEALKSIYRSANREQMQKGGNRAIGRQLYRLLSHSGLTDVRLDAITVHSDETDISYFNHQMSPDNLLSALSNGFISPAEYALACSEYERFLSSPDAFILMLAFLATGRKPYSG